MIQVDEKNIVARIVFVENLCIWHQMHVVDNYSPMLNLNELQTTIVNKSLNIVDNYSPMLNLNELQTTVVNKSLNIIHCHQK
jgi:hypothetical protein